MPRRVSILAIAAVGAMGALSTFGAAAARAPTRTPNSDAAWAAANVPAGQTAGIQPGVDLFATNPSGYYPVDELAGRPVGLPPIDPRFFDTEIRQPAFSRGPWLGTVLPYLRPCLNGVVACDAAVNTGTGGLAVSATDLSLPGIGLPFDLTRTYNSSSGWTYSVFWRIDFDVNGDANVDAGTGQELHFTHQSNNTYVGDPGALSTLVPIAGGYVMTQHDGTRFQYDASGRLIAVTNPNADKQSYFYDSPGHLVQVKDTAGRLINFTYSSGGLLVGVGVGGTTVTYAYNAGNQLTSVTGRSGALTRYAYDSMGRLVTIIDANAHAIVNVAYDSMGRVTTQKDALGKVTSFAYSSSPQKTTITDPLGHAVVDQYSGNVLLSHTDAIGDTTSVVRDSSLNLTGLTDPLGNSYSFLYDTRGNVTKVTDPLYSVSYTYDAHNAVTGYTDGRGSSVAYTYDGRGNLTSASAGGSTTLYQHAANGLVTRITDPRGDAWTYTYAAGNLISATTPMSDMTRFQYDALGLGRLTKVTDPTNVALTYVYDRGDRLIRITDGSNQKISFNYDPLGNLLSRTDQNGGVTRFRYDADGRYVKTVSPLNETTAYQYDADGRVVSLIDGNAHKTLFEYDISGRLTKTTSALGASTMYAYDADGNAVKRTRQNGAVISANYDHLGRRIDVSYSDGTPSVSLVYDGNDNRISMTDAAGTLQTQYDSLGRVTQSARGSLVQRFTYDANSNLLTYTYPDAAVVSYQYDLSNRLREVSGGLGGGPVPPTTFQYDAAGRLLVRTFPSAAREQYQYDSLGRLQSVSHVDPGNALLNGFQYAYDAAGNVIAEQTALGPWTLTHDADGRITSLCFTSGTCSGSSGNFVQYTYDSVSNRVSETTQAGTTNYAYDAANERVSASGVSPATYTYDADGNLTAAPNRSFNYNLAGELIGAVVGGAPATYMYDGDGNLVASNSEGLAQAFVLDPRTGLPVISNDTHGTELARFVWAGALQRQNVGPAATVLDGPPNIRFDRPAYASPQPVSLTISNNNSFYMVDGQGSFATLTDAAGHASFTQISDLFGVTRGRTGTNPLTNVAGYLSRPTDPLTGLVGLSPAQNYDASSDRSQQPYASSAGPRYLFAENNPIPPRSDETLLSLGPLAFAQSTVRPSTYDTNVNGIPSVRTSANSGGDVFGPNSGPAPGVIGAPQPAPPPPLPPPPGVDWLTWLIYYWSFFK